MNAMRKLSLLCMALFCLALATTAHPVDLATAKAIASKFMGADRIQLAATYTTSQNEAALRVFNTANGFVIVAADDGERPIIGYSHEGCFDPDNLPLPLEAYLQECVARIQHGIEHRLDADEVTARQWQRVKSTGKPGDAPSGKAVAPLLSEQWHQGCGYNNLCPTIQGPCGHAEVGCVALAMGQIMHYWGYPATGWGTHSYSDGTHHTADFGNTTYRWDHMPDSLTGQSSPEEVEAVATLLFHCGVSVNMRYGVNGSSASVDRVPEALIQYFDYSRQLHMEIRSRYNDEAWDAMLKECLDQARPILYSGFGTAGHSFVCDGYDENDLFHFNWGWGGNANGYFSIGNLNPNGYQFNNTHFALLDIIPQYEPCQVNATVFPHNAGSVEGTGTFHYGTRCTLTTTPAEGFVFHGWKIDGELVSQTASYSFTVKDDTDIEAFFSFLPAGQITASITPDGSPQGSSSARLSWTHEDTGMTLLKRFKTNGETSGVATDGESIYIAYAAWNDPPFMLEKYTMDGILVDAFNLDGISDVFALTYDGTDFYCNSLEDDNSLSVLYRLDLEHKTILDSIPTNNWAATLAYDPVYDGFWLGHDNRLFLLDRQGHELQSSPMTNDYIYGTGHATANDGSSHLLMVRDFGVYNYDIVNHAILPHPLSLSEPFMQPGYGACTGKYDGKDAFFFINDSSLCIYEINPAFPQYKQIVHYRLFRSNPANEIVTVADSIMGFDYLDPTWQQLPVGPYRYGICSVFADGSVTETIWSDTLVKTDYGIGESSDGPVSVFPNPVNDKLMVEHERPILRCEVFSLEGKEVYSAAPCRKRVEIPTQRWASGTYLLRITTDDGIAMRQVIKVKE